MNWGWQGYQSAFVFCGDQGAKPRGTIKVVILYEDNLNDKIQSLLDYLNIENKGIYLERSNVTRKKEGEEVTLDENDIAWLKEQFKEDYELWNKAHSNHELFKIVI